MNKYLRKDLKDFKPYHANYIEYNIKLDANENPYSHNQKVINKIKKWLENKDNITRYPDTDSTELRRKIAKLYNLTKDNVICTVGSDQLIDTITKVFIEPGDCILVPDPSFSMYELYNTLNHGKTIKYELNEDFTYPIEKIIKLYQEKNPKIIFLCTPNNPTGSTISIEEIEKLLENIECPLVVDEAYAEFIEETIIDKLHKYNNLIILRTFSKAYGLAGLRVGYGIANRELIELINIAKPPYNLSSFSQAVACIILDEIKQYKDVSKVIKLNRNKLVSELQKLPIIDTIYPSEANFILIKVNDMGIVKWLLDNKILVRTFKDKRLANCIRITVGNQYENKKLIKTFIKYLNVTRGESCGKKIIN